MFDLSGPIVRSRLEPDFYKFTMGQLIWRKYRDVQVTFSLTNRTAQARLGRVIDVAELREHLDHVRSLMFTDSEVDYLRRTSAYQDRMFTEGYLEFLRQLRLPECEVSARDDNLVVEGSGRWSEVTYWETIVLSIVNELYYRTLLRRLSRFERQAIFAEGARRLRDKIRTLRGRPDVVLSDFGTRRRFAGPWQHFVVETLRDELNGGGAQGPFLGTSNTFAAMTSGVAPMGTSAHELPMVLAGLLDPGDADPAWLAAAQRQVLDDWWEQYGWALSIFLPDTFGTEFFYTVATAGDLQSWKGFRWDSGNLDDFGELVIRKYEEAGVDPRTKLLVPSDALDLPLILDAQARFGGRIGVSFGWGTGLTNDLLDNVMIDGAWFGPMSLVMKAARANGRGLVKLSDNPAKATGEPADVARYRQAAAYGLHEAVIPKY